MLARRNHLQHLHNGMGCRLSRKHTAPTEATSPCNPQLRIAAEVQLSRAQPMEAPAGSTDELLHELQVHQIELEMQNEELRRAKISIEASRDRYVDRYELAPVGYLTLTSTGQISETNLAGAMLLGDERAKLLQHRFDHFVAAEDRDRWHLTFDSVMRHAKKLGIELTLQRGDGSAIYVHLDCLRVEVAGATAEMHLAMTHFSAMDLNTQLLAAQDALREQLLFQSSLLESVPVPIFYKDCQGRYQGCNQAYEEILGKSRSEIIGKTVFDMAPPEIADKYHAMDMELFQHPGRQVYEWVIQKPSGERRNAVFHKATFLRSDGTVGGQIGAIVDTTEIQRAEEALRASERRFRNLVETTSDWIWEVDESAVYTYVSPRVYAVLGYEPAEIIGKTPFDLMPEQEAKRVAGIFGPIAAAQEAFMDMENTCLHKDGHPVILETNGVPVIDQNGKFCGYRGIDRDITERKRYMEQLERKSNYDDLTGLPNRNLLADRLTQVVARCQREQESLAVLVLNLDRFGEINDSLGRDAGDGILCETAERLRQLAREMDTLARSAGDEFVLVAEIGEVEEAASFARRILKTLAQPYIIAGREISLRASVGISMLLKDGGNSEILLNNAQVAMYRIKASGGGNLCFYSPEMNAHALEHLDLENDLCRAIERDELLLYYQPKVSLHNGEIIGMEALVRWQHPVRGMVSPAEFIPLAESTGLIVPIGEWVMRTACKQNQAWQEAGLNAMMVAVNMSARQFEVQDVVALTKQVLNETGLAPMYLELELTESAAIDNSDAFIGLTEKLKGLSVTLSIDDFGTGYSSLSYLKRFMLDRLKIDQSFVSDIEQDPSSAAIVSAIIVLAHGLGLSVIAEGVETEAQLNFMRTHSCDEMQGYYFSKPLPAAEFEQLLREGRKLSLPASTEFPEQTLLLVDDEPAILSALQRLLRREGYRILTATSAHEGLELLALHEVAVVMSDQRMPQMTGAEFLAKVRKMYPNTIRIILSGYTDLKSVTETVNSGEIYKFMAKPWEETSLRETLREAFLLYKARRAGRQ